MDGNQNCTACNIKLDEDKFKKNRTVCKDCYNKKNNKIVRRNYQFTKSTCKIEHFRLVLVFRKKTHFMLKFFSRLHNQDFYIITNSPPEQFSNSKIKFTEIGEEIKPLNEYESNIIVFGDILGSSSSSYKDQFFKRRRHYKLDISYLLQSYFDLPKRSKSYNGNKKNCSIKH